jgi:hypothetical protein
VGEHVGVLAPGVLEGVGEDRQPVERPVGVDRLRQAEDGRRPPAGVECDWAERVADDAAKQLDFPLARLIGLWIHCPCCEFGRDVEQSQGWKCSVVGYATGVTFCGSRLRQFMRLLVIPISQRK